MKKYWQVRPWMFIVAISVVAVCLLYAFSNIGYMSFPQSSTKSLSISGVEMMPPVPAMDSYGSREMAMIESQDYAGNMADEKSAVERMIIKTGSLSMVVEDVRESVEDIVSYAEEKGGFLVSSDINKSGINLGGSLTIRVPSNLLDATITYIKEMGDVEREHIDGRDITEEYVDLEAQLGNLRATEEQFLNIMKDAVEVEDILNVQRELSYVRGNIERIEGKMKYLKESVDLSSLTVYLSTDPSNLPVIDEEDQWKPLAVFKDALRSLLSTSKGILNMIIWLGAYLPIIIVILLIGWGTKRYINKGKK